MIGIVDYGMGNVASLRNALKYLGYVSIVTDDVHILREATHIILPGVGSFRAAMEEIDQRGLREPLVELATEKPFIGICLGMQLLFTQGTEGGVTRGLNLIPGTVEKLETELVLPHIGWNALQIVSGKKEYSLFHHQSVYFVHSFGAKTEAEYIVATAEYGTVIPAIVRNGNVLGMQLHPEKSGKVGLSLLETCLREGVRFESSSGY